MALLLYMRCIVDCDNTQQNTRFYLLESHCAYTVYEEGLRLCHEPSLVLYFESVWESFVCKTYGVLSYFVIGSLGGYGNGFSVVELTTDFDIHRQVDTRAFCTCSFCNDDTTS